MQNSTQVEKKVFRLNDIKIMYGISKPTIYRMMDEGIFPRPVLLSKRAVGWLASSLDDYDNKLKSTVDCCHK